MCHVIIKCTLLQHRYTVIKLINLFYSFVLFSLCQNFTPLEEMQMVDPACFPFCTKMCGTQSALRLTPQESVLGVRFKQNMNKNSGAIARLTVSRACEK